MLQAPRAIILPVLNDRVANAHGRRGAAGQTERTHLCDTHAVWLAPEGLASLSRRSSTVA